MAPISEEAVAAMRAILNGDDNGHELLQGLSYEVEQQVALLMATSLAVLVSRRFERDCDRTEIADTVARIRSRVPAEIDQEIAVQMIGALLGGPAALDSFDEDAKAMTQALLVTEFLVDEGLTESNVDKLLTSARLQAQQIEF